MTYNGSVRSQGAGCNFLCLFLCINQEPCVRCTSVSPQLCLTAAPGGTAPGWASGAVGLCLPESSPPLLTKQKPAAFCSCVSSLTSGDVKSAEWAAPNPTQVCTEKCCAEDRQLHATSHRRAVSSGIQEMHARMEKEIPDKYLISKVSELLIH